MPIESISAMARESEIRERERLGEDIAPSSPYLSSAAASVNKE